MQALKAGTPAPQFEKALIRWSYVSPIGVNRGADGILKALADMDGSKS